MTTPTKEVTDAYHRAWTARRFDDAIALLSPGLQVEVPINDYPTRESFAEALRDFGSQVNSVDVLSAMAAGDQAMMLYDMDVRGLGQMRVVEHFTVAEGKIVRLRQIHDTAAVRGGTLDQCATIGSGPTVPEGSDYQSQVDIDAPVQRVFESLTTLRGIAGWWTSLVEGSGTSGGRIDLGFTGLEEKITMQVGEAVPMRSVVWTCTKHTGHPEWVGTRIVFQISDANPLGTRLRVHHVGLVPQLNCYDQCEAGWDHFLQSIKSYVEHGQGLPFNGRALQTEQSRQPSQQPSGNPGT